MNGSSRQLEAKEQRERWQSRGLRVETLETEHLTVDNGAKVEVRTWKNTFANALHLSPPLADLKKAARHPVPEPRPFGRHRECPDISALGSHGGSDMFDITICHPLSPASMFPYTPAFYKRPEQGSTCSLSLCQHSVVGIRTHIGRHALLYCNYYYCKGTVYILSR